MVVATDYRYKWSYDFLRTIGNANPDPRVVQWVRAWTFVETGNPATGAAYNLLNTTEGNTPGVVSNFNQVGVKNYNSYQNGIAANAKVLQNGLYGELLTALRTNNVGALGITNGQPSAGVQAGLHTWSGGAGLSYVQGILQHMGVALQNTGIPSYSGGGIKKNMAASTPQTSASTPASTASGFGPCNIPGAVFLFPTCSGQALGQAIGQQVQSTTQQAGQAATTGVQNAITGAVSGLGKSLLNAIGVKSVVDLEQRAALIGVAIILFFIGVGVIFFAHKDTVIQAATAAAEPAAEEEEAEQTEREQAAKEAEKTRKKEEKAAAKPKRGLKKGAP